MLPRSAGLGPSRQERSRRRPSRRAPRRHSGGGTAPPAPHSGLVEAEPVINPRTALGVAAGAAESAVDSGADLRPQRREELALPHLPGRGSAVVFDEKRLRRGRGPRISRRRSRPVWRGNAGPCGSGWLNRRAIVARRRSRWRIQCRRRVFRRAPDLLPFLLLALGALPLNRVLRRGGRGPWRAGPKEPAADDGVGHAIGFALEHVGRRGRSPPQLGYRAGACAERAPPCGVAWPESTAACGRLSRLPDRRRVPSASRRVGATWRRGRRRRLDHDRRFVAAPPVRRQRQHHPPALAVVNALDVALVVDDDLRPAPPTGRSGMPDSRECPSAGDGREIRRRSRRRRRARVEHADLVAVAPARALQLLSSQPQPTGCTRTGRDGNSL